MWQPGLKGAPMSHMIALSTPLACGQDLWLSPNRQEAAKAMGVTPMIVSLYKTPSSQERERDALLPAWISAGLWTVHGGGHTEESEGGLQDLRTALANGRKELGPTAIQAQGMKSANSLDEFGSDSSPIKPPSENTAQSTLWRQLCQAPSRGSSSWPTDTGRWYTCAVSHLWICNNLSPSKRKLTHSSNSEIKGRIEKNIARIVRNDHWDEE